jgi:hypothetical protein
VIDSKSGSEDSKFRKKKDKELGIFNIIRKHRTKRGLLRGELRNQEEKRSGKEKREAGELQKKDAGT